jgi:AcrR family transcriptional regulator
MSENIAQPIQSKRQLIMEAGLAVFSQKGFHKAKIEEIAQEAGIGKGTVYEYFTSKEQLFQEILREGMESFDAAIQKRGLKEGSSREKLTELVRQSILLWRRYQPLARGVMSEITLFDESFRTWLMQIHYERLLFIRKIVEEGISKKELRPVNGLLFARLFYGGLSMIISPYEQTILQDEEMERLAEETVDYYLKGISTKEYR